MFSVRREQSKIRRVVIRHVTVNVIYHLARLEVTTQRLLHHEPVLSHIPRRRGVRVPRSLHQDIAVIRRATPAPEVVVLHPGFTRQPRNPEADETLPN